MHKRTYIQSHNLLNWRGVNKNSNSDVQLLQLPKVTPYAVYRRLFLCVSE